MNNPNAIARSWRTNRCLSAATASRLAATAEELPPTLNPTINKSSLRGGSYFPALLDTEQSVGPDREQSDDHHESGGCLVLGPEVTACQVLGYADHERANHCARNRVQPS